MSGSAVYRVVCSDHRGLSSEGVDVYGWGGGAV